MRGPAPSPSPLPPVTATGQSLRRQRVTAASAGGDGRRGRRRRRPPPGTPPPTHGSPGQQSGHHSTSKDGLASKRPYSLYCTNPARDSNPSSARLRAVLPRRRSCVNPPPSEGVNGGGLASAVRRCARCVGDATVGDGAGPTVPRPQRRERHAQGATTRRRCSSAAARWEGFPFPPPSHFLLWNHQGGRPLPPPLPAVNNLPPGV